MAGHLKFLLPPKYTLLQFVYRGGLGKLPLNVNRPSHTVVDGTFDGSIPAQSEVGTGFDAAGATAGA